MRTKVKGIDALVRRGRVYLLTVLTACVCLPVVGDDSPALDNSFFFPSGQTVRSVLPQPDGKIVIGGSSFYIEGVGSTRIARLNSDGTFEPNFLNPTYTQAGLVNELALQDDGRIIFAGTSGTLGRLAPAGMEDSTFVPPTFFPLHGVRSVVIQGDGRILIGGDFVSFSGASRRIARLDSNGSEDTTFPSYASDTVNCLALQSDGKYVVSGAFASVNGVSRSRMARITADGTLDPGFNPSVGGGAGFNVSVAAVQQDGKVVFGGSFTAVAGQPRNNIARVLPDGTLDASFNPDVTGTVHSIALQTDGKIVIGGTFISVGGQPRENLARLTPDGSLDPSFTVEATGNSVSGIAIQSDGKILVAGSFTNLGSMSRTNLGRLLPTDAPYEAWTRNADELVWLRGGGGPELVRARFDYSLDEATWIPLGEGARTSGGWKVAGLSTVPGDVAVRCTGYVRGGRHAGSGWWFQSTVNLASVVSLRILSDDQSFGITDHQFGFKISGPSDRSICVETSTNLIHWTPIWTNTSDSNSMIFSDPQPATAPCLFYRARYL
jgi:uncharacterized delta-60 repeat protein